MLERKKILRGTIATAVAVVGAKAMMDLAKNVTPSAEAAELPNPNVEQANPAFSDHLRGEYSGVRLVDQPVEAKRDMASSVWVIECRDFDISAEYRDGRDPWKASFIRVWYSNGEVKEFPDECGGRSYAGPNTLREMFCPVAGGTGEWIVHYSLVPGAIGCEDGRLIREELESTPEPGPTPGPTPGPDRLGSVTADVSVSVHALMPIEGICREVGLDGLGLRLTGCKQPELQTEGIGGEAHWHFWEGFGNGFHGLEWWNGDTREWQSLLEETGKQITFTGNQLRLGRTLQLGKSILWNTCR